MSAAYKEDQFFKVLKYHYKLKKKKATESSEVSFLEHMLTSLSRGPGPGLCWFVRGSHTLTRENSMTFKLRYP